MGRKAGQVLVNLLHRVYEPQGPEMKKIAHTGKPSMDRAYSVSAADVADKLIDRMSRGLDPWLLSHPVLALVSAGPFLRARSPRKFD